MFIRKAAIIAASLLTLLVIVKWNKDVAAFTAILNRGEAMHTMALQSWSEAEKQELYHKITAEAEARSIAPINARIDRVWHAIPGYNGLIVDVEKTYEAALRAPQSAGIPFYYKEVEPEIGLRHLGPHPVYRGNPNKKMIAFMINVAWGNEYIDPILKTLEDEKVKATFFLDGSWLRKNPDIAKKIQAGGHEMSNHAYSHPDMKALNRSQQYEEIAKTEQLLVETLNVKNQWFAPPSGSYNQATVQIAKEQGLQTVLWTLDTVDWRKPSAESVVRKIDAGLEPGALILMHPTEASRDALAGMIASARAKGYAIGTVADTLSSARISSSEVEGASGF